MKRPIYDIAGYRAFKAHCKTEALRYLLESFKPDGTTERDADARAGLVYILEEISNEMRSVYQMLDVVKASDLSKEADDPWGYVKGYPLHGFEEIREMTKDLKEERS